MVNVAIIGATGYVGIEITRILQNHPGVKIAAVTSQSFTGQKISDIYPNLKNVFDLECTELDMDRLLEAADIFITAIPHSLSKDIIPPVIAAGKRVIDHGGDFRFRDVKVYEEWYKTIHQMPELISEAVYGLPELYRKEIATKKIVSNPGCYPTCSILGLAPLLKNNLIDTQNIIIDAVSGVTGAGRKTELPYSFCECTENFRAYGVSTHRHTPEIEQEVSILAGEPVVLSFTPHLAPLKRGMLCTTYANLKGTKKTSELVELYKDHYKNEYFVRVLDEGKLPETKNVAGSNFIDISVVADPRLNRVVVLSSLDNLGKGSAAQAVQDLNIMCGYDEKTALSLPGLYF